MKHIPCPYVYKGGRSCKGHVTRVEAFKADLVWSMIAEGEWAFSVGAPHSHYHLHCSKQGNHAGFGRDDALKFYYSELSPELQAVVGRTQ
jgi:hypothetical protein